MLTKTVELKSLIWMGSSLEDLRAFPEQIRKDAGFQLHRIQAGLEAVDWKPMAEIGKGVAEVRLRDRSGNYRVIYLSRTEDAVYILHCFNKKCQRTRQQDKTIASARYQAVQRFRSMQ